MFVINNSLEGVNVTRRLAADQHLTRAWCGSVGVVTQLTDVYALSVGL